MMNDGHSWIVDIDLEKFFDTVNHDKLMTIIGRTIKDGDVISIVRKFLVSGVIIDDEYEDSIVGTPQGGNISPLLAKIMLNELDKEMESRGLDFVRYADDCIIMVGSELAASRVMKSISKFIEEKLGLKVNVSKSKVDKPKGIKYLGFGFYYDTFAKQYKAKPHARACLKNHYAALTAPLCGILRCNFGNVAPLRTQNCAFSPTKWNAQPGTSIFQTRSSSVAKFKAKMKKFTCRSWGVNNKHKIEKLNQLIRGWINYFKIGSRKKLCKNLDGTIRYRLRMCIWKHWKTPKNRAKNLIKLGIPKWAARRTSYAKGFARVCRSSDISQAINNERLAQFGLISMLDYYIERCVTC